MSKFFSRIGKSKHSYRIVVTIEKVELNLKASVKMQVSLKRGDHVVKTKGQPEIEKGYAVFLEDLVVPATMYFDSKKSEYMEKEGVIAVTLLTPKGPKPVGATKIDFGKLLTEAKEHKLKVPIQKCIDKNAKFHIRVQFVGGPDGLKKRSKTPGDAKEEKGSKKKESIKLSKKKSSAKEAKKSKVSESEEEKDQESDEDDSDDDDDDEDDGKTSSFHLSNYTSRTGRSKANKKSKNHLDSDSDRSHKAKSVQEKHGVGLNDFFSSKTFNPQIMTPTSEVTVSASHQMRQFEHKNIELETKCNNYQKENQELYGKLHEAQEELFKLKRDHEDLKFQYEKLQREKEVFKNDLKAKDTIDKRSDIELKVHKEKMSDLEHQIQQLQQEKRKTKDQYDELKKINDELTRKVEFFKAEEKKQGQLESFEIDRLKGIIEEQNERISKTESHFRLARDRFQKEFDENMETLQDSEKRNRKLQTEVLRLEAKITDLEGTNELIRNEIKTMKNSQHDEYGMKKDNSRYLDTIDETEEKHRKIEENYRKRIEELLEELSIAKAEAGKSSNKNLNKKFETDSEIAIMSLENESLKKQLKELTQKVAAKKEDNKADEYKAKILEMEDEKSTLEKEISRLKLKIATHDKEVEQLQKVIQESEDNNSTRQRQLTDAQQSYFIAKSQIAQIMNVCGQLDKDGEILDAIEEIIMKK